VTLVAGVDCSTQSTKVVVCDKTCSRFKATPTGQVEIGFGCKREVIK